MARVVVVMTLTRAQLLAFDAWNAEVERARQEYEEHPFAGFCTAPECLDLAASRLHRIGGSPTRCAHHMKRDRKGRAA